MIFNNIEDVNKNIDNIDNIDKNSCNNSDEINDKVIRKTIIKSLISIVGVMLLTILVFIKPSVNSIITKIYYLLSLIASFGLVLLMPKVFDYILKKGKQVYVKLSYEISDFFSIFIIACCLVQSFFVFGYFRAEVSGDSMLPNFVDGETLIGKSTTKVENFDVVIVTYKEELNGGFYASSIDDGELLIKRLIGKAGDSLYFNNGLLYLNGELVDEYYLDRRYSDTFTLEKFVGKGVTYDEGSNKFIIEDGYYFVMGDNRNISLDSRLLGLFEEDQLVGKVEYRLNSLFDWEKLS